jgi:hypothetical protein
MTKTLRIAFSFVLILPLLAGAVSAQKRTVKRAAARTTARKTVARKRAIPPPAPIIPLARLLPKSDAIVSFNLQKVIDNALPYLLGPKTAALSEINKTFDELKNKVGVDLREFKQAAIGVKYNFGPDNKINIEPVILAGGNFKSAAILGLLKLAGAGKYREESASGKLVYVFDLSSPEAAKPAPSPDAPAAAPENAQEKAKDSFEQMFSALSKEVAVTSLDDNTLVIGTLARVQETLSGSGGAVDRELMEATEADPGAMVSFGGNMPSGFAAMLGMDDPELSKLIDSIKSVSGSFDLTPAGAPIALSARTFTPEQAQSLGQTLTGLQMVGKSLVGTIKGSPQEKAIYTRLVNSVKIDSAENSVRLNLVVSKSDLDTLLIKLLK